MWYWFFKFTVVGPFVLLVFPPRWRGRENLPRTGAFVLAANHTSMVEAGLVPLGVPRRVIFVAKGKYYRSRGVVGRVRAWFLTAIGQVPIEPESATTARPALETATKILQAGGVWGVFPEGTRSPDGRMYQGRTGCMRVALPLGVPIIPVAVTGARTIGPWWKWGRGRTRAHITYLPAFDTSPWSGREHDPAAWREATDALMARIREVTGQEYVDRAATPEELATKESRKGKTAG